MLAERKYKMKWSLNPCGNIWAKDSSKFGQKILEKFGWTPGKGLGANEQGIVTPIRLKCNSTQKGLGFERGSKVDFFQHQEEFSSILSNLNSTTSSESKETCLSLEQTSKNCKTRVHYHKFTRGKDLSRYSEKDLSCILGVVSSLENIFESRNQTSPILNDNVQNLESYENCNLLEEQNQSSHGDDKKEKRKKKKKRKCENIDEIPENNKSDQVEIYLYPIDINSSIVERTSTISNENPSKKNRRKRKCEIDDNTIVENKEEEFTITNESQFEEYNSSIQSENKSNKKKRKQDIIRAEILNNHEESQRNVAPCDSNDQNVSNKISKKKKKNK